MAESQCNGKGLDELANFFVVSDENYNMPKKHHLPDDENSIEA